MKSQDPCLRRQQKSYRFKTNKNVSISDKSQEKEKDLTYSWRRYMLVQLLVKLVVMSCKDNLYILINSAVSLLGTHSREITYMQEEI